MGLQADAPDKRDLKFKAISSKLLKTRGIVDLPSAVDLRRIMSPIRDQATIGSCTAFAIGTGLVESLMIEHLRDPVVEISPLFLYYYTRHSMKTITQDSGATLRDAVKTAANIGVCPEEAWPYDPANFTKKPPPAALKAAMGFRLHKYYRVKDLQDLKISIACQNPVVLGMHLFESFQSPNAVKTGIVQVPDTTKEKYLGGHAMMACGWDDARNAVLLRNSWGKAYGESGYVWVPYACFDLGLIVDMWTATA